MKIFLSILSLMSLIASSAFASTARMSALQNPFHEVDIVGLFDKPSDMHLLPEAALLEYGPASTLGSTTKGGFLRAMGESKIGFFLGAGSVARSSTTDTLQFIGVENPFSVFYGQKLGSEMGWGLGVTYSSSTKKTPLTYLVGSTSTKVANFDSAKQNSLNLAASLDMGHWTAGLTTNIINTATTSLTSGDSTYKGGKTSLFGTCEVEAMNYRLGYDMDSEKISDPTADLSNKSTSTLSLAFINTHKKDGTEFFYGASYLMKTEKDTVKTTDAKVDTTTLPIIVGLESEAASWLVLRGSITQNVLIGSTKNDSGTDSTLHNTTVASGLGFKFNKSVLDMTLSAASTGAIKSSDFGANAAYTYMF